MSTENVASSEDVHDKVNEFSLPLLMNFLNIYRLALLSAMNLRKLERIIIDLIFRPHPSRAVGRIPRPNLRLLPLNVRSL